MPATESEVETPSAGRLVIRVKLIPQEELPPPPQPPRLGKPALLVIVGVVAVLLGWLGISTFKSDPPPAPATKTEPVKAMPVEPAVTPKPDAPLSPVHEAVPDVPKSALDTITGTVKVSVRVTIDKQGAVTGAVVEERGPSRYFQRLAVDAAKKWTFTPATLEEQRTMLLKFNFTRNGATADAD
ncbi:TonB family protein [Steroidobacter flavus]|uniref:TonB family protein n=1 Tax=Steroidobacter flavus TaxID=1842136 RepID=A0ABV8T493_9GAMM